MKNSILQIIIIVLIFALFISIPIYAAADSDELTININVYQGSILTGTTTMYAFPYEDLNITALNEIYGNPQTADVFVNGLACIVFAWSLPDSIVYMTPSYGYPEIGDDIQVNIYYPAAETNPPDEEIITGTLTLDLSVNDNDSPTNYFIFLNGIKGVSTFSDFYYFPEDGILTLENLDISYNWEYTFNGTTWPITFDENNFYYNQLSVQTLPEPGEIISGNAHTVYVTWEYCQEAGGNMVDGHADNAFVAGNTYFSATSGEILDLNYLYQNPPGATYIGDNFVQVGNNIYRMSSVYRSGNNVQAGGELDNFTMIDDDLDVTFTYIFDHSIATEVEKEIIKEVEVPVEVIKEVEKEVPVEVEKVVEKETIKEVAVPVEVEKIIEREKQVPVIVEKPTYVEIPSTNYVERIVEQQTVVQPRTTEREVIVQPTTTTGKEVVIQPVPIQQTNNTNKDTTTPTVTPTPTTNNKIETIEEDSVPLAEFEPPVKEEESAQPLSKKTTWSLIDLGLLIFTFLIFFCFEIGISNILTTITILLNIVIYVLTQNLYGSMVLIDFYTIPMAIICLIGVGFKYFWVDIHKEKENKNLE